MGIKFSTNTGATASLADLVLTKLGTSVPASDMGSSVEHRYHPTEYKHYSYFANGWSKPLRWDGIQNTTYQVGIEAPNQFAINTWNPAPTTAAGSVGLGVHLIRYRYMDSSTGYVSNPSEEREIVVTDTAKKLIFQVGVVGAHALPANISYPGDGKVDKIILEMTVAGGTQFFQAAEWDTVSAGTLEVDISDAALAISFLNWPDYGHEPPPVTKYLIAHKRRLWAFGQIQHSAGTVAATNGSASVVGTSHNWNQEALGSAEGESDVKWFLAVEGDTREYEIESFDGTNTITLADTYAGVTASGLSYKIGTRANVIWVSNAGFPEGFTSFNFMETPQGLFTGTLTAGFGYGNSMLFFTQHSMFKLAWDQDPLVDPFMTNITTKHGALSQRVVVEVDGKLYAMDQHGWHIFAGGFPQKISKPVDSLLEDLNFALKENFHAAYYPKLRAIRWFVCYTGDSSDYPTKYLQYDLDTGNWSTGEYYQGISESRLVPWEDGTMQVLLGDENGHVWVADYGTADGASSANSHIVTGGSCTTTRIFPATQLFPNIGAGISGCYAYWVEEDELRLVDTSSSTKFDVTVAFSSAPAAGQNFWIGPIPSKLKTKAFMATKTKNKKRSNYLTLQFQPTTRAGELKARVYEDYSTTKKAWRAGGNNLDGLTWPATTTTDWKVDTSFADGVVDIPIGSEFRRCFEVELEITEPDIDIEFLSIEHDGGEVGDMT